MKAAAYVQGLSFAAPGLPDWRSACSVLRGEQPYTASELPPYQSSLLPANERRRASPTVRMAFRVAEAATQSTDSDVSASQLAAVFSSSDGDLGIAQRICTALASAPRLISPTDFHNSVHNAAAGYWSIASAATGPSTAIAAFDDSFAVGLMEAMGMVCVEHTPTLLVAYDVPSPTPLHAARPLANPVAVAMVLTPHRTAQSVAKLHIDTTQASATPMPDTILETLRMSNPAARALPLLWLLARQHAGQVQLALPNKLSLAIHIDVQCPT